MPEQEQKVTTPEIGKVQSPAGEAPKGLDAFLKDGAKIPELGLEDALNDEAERVNAELEKPDKTETPPAPAEPPKSEKPKEQEKTAITDEQRKKLNIPDKFKYMEDVVAWGSEAEKAKAKAEAEKDRARNEISKTEERLAKMEETLTKFSGVLDKKVDDGTITEEQRLVEEEKLKYLLENSPLEFVETVRKNIEKQYADRETKKQQEESEKQTKEFIAKKNEQYVKELDEMKTEYGEDKFNSEVFPALKKIAAEKPYLQSFREAESLYLVTLRKAEEKAKAEAEAARTKKIGASSESSASSGAAAPDSSEESRLKAIDGADSIAELDKLVGLQG